MPSATTSPDHPRPTANGLGGTGVIITADGVILTNEHVIRNARHVTVTLADGSVHEVQRIQRAEKLDLAVLYIGARTETSLPPAKCFADPGIPVVAFSAARCDKPGGVRTGIITKRTVSLQRELDPSRTRWYDDLIESSAKLEPGYSGGPLLDMQGRLIGINTAAFGGPDDDYARAYAIPLHQANRKVIDSLVRRLTRQD
ncbi:MAG: trypsin-like peptidase domain-containing protein [Planctomycetes bacterium]|nr:trypsin-like peptidase domain-containing protein [Planctomycetota bacterium]